MDRDSSVRNKFSKEPKQGMKVKFYDGGKARYGEVVKIGYETREKIEGNPFRIKKLNDYRRILRSKRANPETYKKAQEAEERLLKLLNVYQEKIMEIIIAKEVDPFPLDQADYVLEGKVKFK